MAGRRSLKKSWIQGVWKLTPLAISWSTWKERNGWIFKSKAKPIQDFNVYFLRTLYSWSQVPSHGTMMSFLDMIIVESLRAWEHEVISWWPPFVHGWHSLGVFLIQVSWITHQKRGWNLNSCLKVQNFHVSNYVIYFPNQLVSLFTSWLALPISWRTSQETFSG